MTGITRRCICYHVMHVKGVKIEITSSLSTSCVVQYEITLIDVPVLLDLTCFVSLGVRMVLMASSDGLVVMGSVIPICVGTNTVVMYVSFIIERCQLFLFRRTSGCA